jgi:hypothetical protein
MNRLQQRRDAADANSFGVAQLLRTFFATAAEEWRKLVAEVAHALAGKANHPADAIEEKRVGDQ